MGGYINGIGVGGGTTFEDLSDKITCVAPNNTRDSHTLLRFGRIYWFNFVCYCSSEIPAHTALYTGFKPYKNMWSIPTGTARLGESMYSITLNEETGDLKADQPSTGYIGEIMWMTSFDID